MQTINVLEQHTLLVLNFSLYILNSVRRLHIQCDGLACKSFDKDLHARATTQTKHQMKRGLLLNIVVGQGAIVFQLLASKNQTLLVRRDACITE